MSESDPIEIAARAIHEWEIEGCDPPLTPWGKLSEKQKEVRRIPVQISIAALEASGIRHIKEPTEEMIEEAARALVRACSDSSEDFEISWHTKGIRETEMDCARAALTAAIAAAPVFGTTPSERGE